MNLHKRYSKTTLVLRYLIIPPVIGLIITLISFPSGFKSIEALSYVLLYSFCIGIPSIALFDLTEHKLDQVFPWLKFPLKRLFLSVFIQVGIILLIFILVNLIFVLLYQEGLHSLAQKTTDGIGWAVGLTFLGILLANTFYFFKNWRQSAVNEERIKHEKLAVEYEALKNQVNPHFLFNSLTALNNLIYEDQEEAVAFTDKISEVYRYILEKRDEEVTPLNDEIELLKSMTELYQYRHGEHLKITINISSDNRKYILTMALQMLLENALKHNTFSGERPLRVAFAENNGKIVVWNNRQPKSHVPHSNGVGLNNILARYRYLTNKEVTIDENPDYFKVEIPILYKS